LRLADFDDYADILKDNIKLNDRLNVYDVNKKDINGKTLLYHLAKDRYLVQFRKLLKLGADQNIGNNDNFTPLMKAICNNSTNIIYLLIRISSTNFNIIDSRGYTCLEYACVHGRNLILNDLLRFSNPSNFKITQILRIHKILFKKIMFGKEIERKLFHFMKYRKTD
jgi:ankyrin repeat protein